MRSVLLRTICEPCYEIPSPPDRRVPTGWKFPKLGLQGMYLYWHSGDEAKNIPPMKFLEPNDVKHLGKRSRTSLGEVRKVMSLIDNEAKIARVSYS